MLSYVKRARVKLLCKLGGEVSIQGPQAMYVLPIFIGVLVHEALPHFPSSDAYRPSLSRATISLAHHNRGTCAQPRSLG